MRKIGILICVLLLTGCAHSIWVSTKLVPLPEPVKKHKIGEINRVFYEKNYKIGEKITAFVGQEIVKVKSFTERTEIFDTVKYIKKVVKSNTTINIHAKYAVNNYHIKSNENQEYEVHSTINNNLGTIRNNLGIGEFNLIELNDDKGTRWGMLIDDNGAVHTGAIYSFEHEMLYFPLVISVSPGVFIIYEKAEGKEEKREIEKTIPGMAIELIYSGKNDVSLNATYREYTPDNMARPAFFQNITYRADAKQLRFKDFVIKLHDVSNEKITYTVLEDGLKE